MINSDIEITIRSIQHYMYCAHRWGLLEIDKAWAENYYVTKANLLHERVHEADNSYTSRGKKVMTSVRVYNDCPEYNIYGVTDCIEITEKNNGLTNMCIVEYKPTKPKGIDFNEDDCIQVFAQKICVDSIFKCNCDGVLYYADVKKRIKLPLNEKYHEYDLKLKELLFEMRKYLTEGVIPQIKKQQKCNGCSMVDICMPKVKKVFSVKDYIIKNDNL